MDIVARKREREKKKEDERLKKLAEEEIFRKPEKAYVPYSKRFTIIVFLIMVAAIVYLILKSEVIVQEQCELMPGLECGNINVADSKISLEVNNYLKEELNISMSLEGCEGTVAETIKPNNKAAYEFTCTLDKEIVKKDINFTHTGYSGLPHDKTGHLTAKVGG